jgi:hypothetical protein
MRFFTGIHQPSDAQHFGAAFVSASRLWTRKSGFRVRDWIMDSMAFTEVAGHGRYRHKVEEYAAQIKRWSTNGNLLAAIAQDWMCEDVALKRAAIAERTLPAPEGFDHDDTSAYRKLGEVPWAHKGQREEQLLAHQERTIERYDVLMKCDVGGVTIIPVLQGYASEEYVRHIEMYGDRLKPGMWVGVGSVCKRNGDPHAIERVLLAIKEGRPDLRLHGFGLKTTALSSPLVNELLHTADSMAWSYAARREGRNPNDWREARSWTERIGARPLQYGLFGAVDNY